MWKRLLLGMAVSLVGTSWAAAADQLSIGDPAPKIEVKEFVKGKPVTKFDKGKTYVVEFWATWCGPCKVSIPHLTELQKKYQDVTFIGVSVFERDQSAVKPFVEKMGDKMDYRVAMDAMRPVPGKPGEDKEGEKKKEEGVMAKTWMEAAKQGGIPTAFIINKNGKIAWIGHPMEMEKPLEQITAGKWDLAVAAANFKKAQERPARLRELSLKLRQFKDEPKKALEAIDKAIKDDPDLEERLAFAKFHFLAAKDGDADKALSYGKQLMEKHPDNAQILNQIAWTIVDPENAKEGAGVPNGKMLKLALEAAEKADKIAKGKDPSIADTLAKVYFDNGEIPKAVETQERAMKLAKGTRLEKDQGMKERLEKYKKASQKDKN
jgi:thiol-disulfide isomerase/thioredoxin